MSTIEDVKTMLTALLKASKVQLTSDEDSSDLNAVDGFDNDNPLAHTDLYRDEQGNRLPNKLHVVPLFGRPVMPSQITTVQLNIEWLDVITEVISSSHHTFAMFSVGEENLKRSKITLSDFPKTGTVVKLLSARSSPDEIDIICEGVRRVSLIEVVDAKTNFAQVRYPEIEYRLANPDPNPKDKLEKNALAFKKSIDDSLEFDKKLKALIKKHKDYAQSIGLDAVPKSGTFEYDYYLYSDNKTIGRISRQKLNSLLEFIGLKDLDKKQQEQLAIFLARPTQAELDQLHQYYLEAAQLINERNAQNAEDFKNLSPRARELMESFTKVVATQDQETSSSSISTSASDGAGADTDAGTDSKDQDINPENIHGEYTIKDVSFSDASDISTTEGSKEKPRTGRGPLTMEEFVRDQSYTKMASEFAKMLATGAVQGFHSRDSALLVGNSNNSSALKQREADNRDELNRNFIDKISNLLEPNTDTSDSNDLEQQSQRRDELFALIAKVGREEDQDTRQTQERFKNATVNAILENTPKDSAEPSEAVAGPNFGFVNEDTSVVTFMPGQESSEELLMRLTELQKQHENMLRKEAANITSKDKDSKDSKESKESDIDGKTPAQSINSDDLAIEINSGTGVSSLESGEDSNAKMIIGEHNGDTETHILINNDDKTMPEDVKEFLNFLMQGKDVADFNPDSSAKGSRSNKWSALQRAAMIRSKLASLLGGKVVFGVGSLNEKQEGAQREVEARAYCLGITAALQDLIPLNPLMTEEMRQYLARFDMSNPSTLADCAASITQAKPQELQQVLDTIPILPRLKLSFELITRELSAAKLQDKIKMAVAEKIQKRQKDFFLREQLTEIKKELGLSADEKDLDVEKFRERMKNLTPPEHIKKRFEEEISKLSMLETSSPEYGLTHNYLDTLTSIPWGKMSKEKLKRDSTVQAAQSLSRARKILDQDHEGLQDVKDRIIEFLAVGALKGQTAGQIMLFVGPPGVGKTSIGKSIAKALNRPFYRLSLGGIDDVSEIKGHRKTYVGAMAGKIVAALRECKVMNPVIMLDEIDKLGKSYHGDPDSALLETLDPEQNKNFLDVYLDEKIDLSNVLFICTANSTDTISAPLLDRMEPIRLSGYIAKEKFAIAKKHLLPRALVDAGLTSAKDKRSIKISDETLNTLIEGYARESGVRSLERAIAKLIRKSAVKLVSGEGQVTITSDDLEDYLGTAPFKREKMLKGVGIMTGLAWTASGGVTLPVESIVTNHDNQGFKLTGSLGDVMKESANIAYSFVQSHLELYREQKAEEPAAKPQATPASKSKKGQEKEEPAKSTNFFHQKSVHLHVPEGAIPKDGPSAGVTMATSLLSLALNEAPQEGFAMTGELTLTGHVLPIGGLREKVIAARRMGIFNLVIPIGNEGDVKELPEQVRGNVTFYYADVFSDVAYTLFSSVQEHLKANGYQAPRCERFDAEGKSLDDKATTSEAKAKAKDKAKATTKTKTKSTSSGSSKTKVERHVGEAAKVVKAPTKKTTAKAKATTSKSVEGTKATKTEAKAAAKTKSAATKAPAAKSGKTKAATAAKAEVKVVKKATTTTKAKATVKPSAKATNKATTKAKSVVKPKVKATTTTKAATNTRKRTKKGAGGNDNK